MEGSSLQVEIMQKVLALVVHERMSQGEEVKCTKEKKVEGWSTEEMKDKEQFWEVDRSNERYESGRDGSMLEELGGRKSRLKFWTSARSRTVQEKPLKAEAPRWSGDGCAKARNTE